MMETILAEMEQDKIDELTRRPFPKWPAPADYFGKGHLGRRLVEVDLVNAINRVVDSMAVSLFNVPDDFRTSYERGPTNAYQGCPIVLVTGLMCGEELAFYHAHEHIFICRHHAVALDLAFDGKFVSSKMHPEDQMLERKRRGRPV